MWDLSDIEKIEIIRGPGSVTYGPGAVAGIINITTKKHTDNNGIQAKANYVYPYQSEGISLGYSKDFAMSHLFVHSSVQNTEGYENPKAYSPYGYNIFNYLGADKSIQNQPYDYFYDYNGLAQLKFQASYSFLDNWDVSLRYTRQGAALNPNFAKQRPQTGFDSLGGIVWGRPMNLIQNQDQHFTINLKNESSLENLFDLTSMISYSSEYYIRRTEWFRASPKEYAPSWDSLMLLQNVNSIWNHNYDFAESSLLGQFIANKNFSEKLKFAGGTEISYNFWGPGWGKDRRFFRMGDNYDIISGKDSYVYGSKIPETGVPEGEGYFVGDGWSTVTYSFLFEMMWQPLEDLSILVSARSDKDTYTPWLFYPRVALIYEFSDNNIIKLVGQQSQRMNTASQLLIQHLSGNSTKPERLAGMEIIYSGAPNEHLLLNVSAFYNNLDVISWYNVGRTTRPTGNLKLYGLEFEGKVVYNGFDLSINQSYVKQLKWELADSVFYSGISFSDYFLELNNLKFESVGNDLNNWSNLVTKILCNYKLFDEKLVLHMDSRVYWKFEGEKDGLKSYENAMQKDHPDYQAMKDMLDIIKKIKMYDTELRLNFSAGWNINEHYKFSVHAMNILDFSGNKRYYYDSGIRKSTSYFRHGFIEEPFTLALKLEIKY
jgi:outer membrane receptor protein involved in Fe transport